MKEFVPISAGYEKARASERPRNGMENRTTEGRANSLTLYTGRSVPLLVRPILGWRAALLLDLDDVSCLAISSAVGSTKKGERRSLEKNLRSERQAGLVLGRCKSGVRPSASREGLWA